jgi:hypothetical protein
MNLIILGVRPDELHQDALESIRDVDHQSVLVPTDVENHAIVCDEIDDSAKLPLYVVRTSPLRPADYCVPRAQISFCLRVPLPELSERRPR